MEAYYTRIFANQSEYYLISTQKGLLFVGSPNADLKEVEKFYPDIDLIESDEFNQDAATQIIDYLNGKRDNFNLKLDIESGTKLQQEVWNNLQLIPRGTTVTYTELAKRVGHPDAVRAVASAVGKNPLMVVIPCHRVIRKDGSVGEYRGGSAMKRRLLAMESGTKL
ncbi:methylated-DNA--[protein]-cysteine S-methyltransferase [Pediococcus claussenii]|uniref:methylated-DNA--[protein]-cysteine S-methyltransferase n=1 Tax=Pediococcus claussenii (strain ATCC BAA-344 / DSM 14800 / JCM 18046 / KCTC 3811 / LMG 21948 / P06) TaxID=701521 RepID=G8PAZ8_PEDCP|nr:methylated-DNA--[protein]-cysteine S-methyltransferase [Pediococcus claussenii]AEV95866.1 methylated-DNA--protein-cysteine methyltransferase, inducible [Pediococcus claussenii ATCC BAA-344]ANZ69362.1 cysteine methyltransferase [Pediococcus claussenii]ANZ71182.1 cysteine methyltransferase [Pediococcus claussenii]KRN20473.1 adaB protein [Pediococcus claussenii]